MPQLDTYTYFVQIEWMVLFFLITYYYVLKVYLPSVIATFKLREKKKHMGKLICSSYDEELKVVSNKIVFACSSVGSSKFVEFFSTILQDVDTLSLTDKMNRDWNIIRNYESLYSNDTLFAKSCHQKAFNNFSFWYSVDLVSSSDNKLDNINESSLIFKSL
jgi:hypothetical protein